MSETKTITVRIPMDLYNKTTDNEKKQFNPTLVEILDNVNKESSIKMLDIKGIFSKQEWIGLADSLNGTIVDDTMRYNKQMLIYHCEDAELYESSFSRHNADVKKVTEKIEKLTNIQVSSVFERIENFWDNNSGVDIDVWANF